ncbi:tyrosine-type recombinase/integrase [Cryobacterium breve]|uniref:Tyrosine-type recombinase/integrase n=1 Tax=Cryobacterium breve TaxID=1259258 RepID=A0ABY7NF44_9MICO|nr:tyrosine-type recombinase/integrase [Cryobacterium breve]
MRGYTGVGLEDSSWRGRSSDRNAAYADLLFDSGLRRSEGAALLCIELPKVESGRRYQWGRLASATSKSRRPRAFNMRSETLNSIQTYMDSTRAGIVRRAQELGTYEADEDRRVVEFVKENSRGTFVKWIGPDLVSYAAPLDRISPRVRASLYVPTDRGLEPCALWLSEDGRPMKSHSWENIFMAATARCRLLLGDSAPFATPHMLRHTFALYMLVALMSSMDSRFGLSPSDRRDFQLLYGDPWRLVQNLLGHASSETTRHIYLAPVTDLQIRIILEGELEDGAEFLSAIALLSGRVQDVDR